LAIAASNTSRTTAPDDDAKMPHPTMSRLWSAATGSSKPHSHLRELPRHLSLARPIGLRLTSLLQTDFHLARLEFVALRHPSLPAAYAASGSRQLLH
jgi:hypothetical protein